MIETANTINDKNIINVSRNKPVAFVVGAAGFFGSHLVDKLLDKEIAVIGVDDLDNGKKQNLSQAVKSKDFHLVVNSPENFNFGLPRLDYIVIVPSQAFNLDKTFALFKRFRCRLLLISSINLYEKTQNEEYEWLRGMESQVAKEASKSNLNARVLRLGPVFGPRMDFKQKDPLMKLIKQVLAGEMQKEVSLDFSTRALFVSDAVDLAVRTIFAGATAQKIFDGVLPTPVKVAEIKQVLLDPVWYERRDFKFSELPPWATPNLERTMKILHWQPRERLVSGLRETLSYFKDNEIPVPKETEKEIKEVKEITEELSKEKRALMEEFKAPREETLKKEQKRREARKNTIPWSKIYLGVVVALISFALIWPSVVLGWGFFAFRYQLDEGLKSLQKGNLDLALKHVEGAAAGISEVKEIYETLEPIRKTGLFKDQFEVGDSLISLSQLSATSARSAVLGIRSLLSSIKAVTGEEPSSPAEYFDYARLELASAREDIALAQATIKDWPKATNIADKLGLYSALVSKAEALNSILPKLVALGGKKDYLILLQNNMELRPTGGFIGSYALVSFEDGKLKKLGVNDIYAIDGNLGIHVEPPKEIKDDLGQKDWFLRDSNWEPDFPTSARQAQWFYTKETGSSVDGVIALDISAIEGLLGVVGPLDLPDYGEEVSQENLFERAVSHAEVSFFPGSQAKKSFLTALTNSLFEKMFFLPQNNWPGILSALGRSLDEKHISIYLNDPKLFSYILSQNWTAVLPRQPEGEGEDFLSLVEANLGANKANYYLDRSYSLETVIGKDGGVSHRLRINYINRSPNDAFPGGRYKNRMRVYLPFNSQLNKAAWGEADILPTVTSFSDYGRSGYSFLLELPPKEQKTLVLDWSAPVSLEFKDGEAEYRLDIIKQAGTLKDPLQWNLSYPINFELASDQEPTKSQEKVYSTDLSSDRSFRVEFRK